MPTGYTAKLMEEGMSFPDFVLQCARAFGALITMRDEPSDAPIPSEFSPSDYHQKCIQQAKESLSRLSAMSADEQAVYSENQKQESIARYEGYIVRETEENERLTGMAEQVRKWAPPSSEHEGLKKFMLEQIEISLHDVVYYENALVELREKPAAKFYAEAITQAERDISYHEEEHKKEVARSNSRTEWVKQLRASLPQQ